ncbi:alpha/beta-hydrolases superfamily protein [Trifolium medium]|uniref:Alpha/beta-hydrolases superfamily protein n=1 Tax=Trifolium medium TaxID=97028 RepID=A0A392NIB1_9FABA|nr:alpha/beta-hydrolases superfamily protein [Trifolium medium]
MEVPAKQIMERQETMTRHSQEYRAALQRAKTLDVPHAYAPPSEYGTFDEEGEESSRSEAESSVSSTTRSKAEESWDVLIERLFDKDEHGHMVLKR